MWLACARPASAETVTLFRVFLNDGTAVVSYGEYARVGDRVVFSMPIGAVDASSGREPDLHVVNIPAAAVNWTATTKYAESARSRTTWRPAPRPTTPRWPAKWRRR